MKIKPCIDGKRHKWVWVKNYIETRSIGDRFKLTKLGLYKCQCCNKTKSGNPAMVDAPREMMK